MSRIRCLLRALAPWLLAAAVTGAGYWTGDRFVAPDPPDPGELDLAPRRASAAEAAALAARTNAAWDRIEAELHRKAPATLAALNGPADPAALDRLGAALPLPLPLPLPPDVRASLLRHDGTAADETFGSYRLLPVADIWYRLAYWEARLRGNALTYNHVRPGDVGRLREWDVGPPALPLGIYRGGDVSGPGLREGSADWELLVDLRDRALLSSYEGHGSFPGGGGDELNLGPRGQWVGYLELIADFLERSSAGEPPLEDGRFEPYGDLL